VAGGDALGGLGRTEPVAAALLVTARQGTALRRRLQPDLSMGAALAGMEADLAARIPLVEEDRALDRELIGLVNAIREEAWDLYAD